jgi:hypothetical protein
MLILSVSTLLQTSLWRILLLFGGSKLSYAGTKLSFAATKQWFAAGKPSTDACYANKGEERKMENELRL